MRAVVFLIFGVLLGFAAASGRPSPAEVPNVVFILADDLGYGELGCYGQEKIPTPNIDRLAAEGTRFTRHYSGAPVCAPSRCVLMTGKHLGRAEIRGNRQANRAFPEFKEGQHPISAEALTMAEVFRDAGYATAAMGKWGLGPVGSTGDPNDQGFDLFFGYNCQAVAHSFFARYVWRNRERIEINPKPVPGHFKQTKGQVLMEDYQGEQYAPRLMLEEAEKWIVEKRDGPFFLYLPFIEPHVAMHPPPELVERFPEDWDDREYRGQCAYLPHPRPRAGYAAMIHDLDRHVGRVMAALEKAGVANETIIVFTSDNGTTLEHAGDERFHVGGVDPEFFNSTLDLRGYKGSVYEGGLRVPMIVRYPGKVKAGAVSDAPGYFADWFPTLCEATGLEAPEELDGESLWPVITGGEAKSERKPMVWTFAGYGGQCAVMMGEMKAVRRGLDRKKPGEWELYNVVADRGETKDLAGEQSEWIRRAEGILSEQMTDNPVFPVRVPGVPVADLVTPQMTDEDPGTGRRVRQQAPEYAGTEVYHALHLPTDWKPGGSFPVMVEYTGNRHPASGSTGQVKDANLGYGLTGGEGFIWVSLPYIEKGGKRNALQWWGDRQATIDYAKRNVPRICRDFGGDPEQVWLCGFSRGAIATSYIGLADDEIAALWKGLIAHDHFDGQREWGYPDCDRPSALQRLGRLEGRPVLVTGTGNDFLREHLDLAEFTFLQPAVAEIFEIPEGKVIHPHTDRWMHRESRWRREARDWLVRH